MSEVVGPARPGNSFGRAKRIWIMSDCPGCGATQYQPGPYADSEVKDPDKKWEWKCWGCGTEWASAPKGRARDSGGR